MAIPESVISLVFLFITINCVYSFFRTHLQGLAVLHESELMLHGHLNSYNILVDNRWNCKLTDYGLFTFKDTSLEVNKDVIVDEEGRFEGKLFNYINTILKIQFGV